MKDARRQRNEQDAETDHGCYDKNHKDSEDDLKSLALEDCLVDCLPSLR